VFIKTILLICITCLLAACSTPAPETLVATSQPTATATPTRTPAPTATPSPTPTPTATPVPRRAILLNRGSVICGIDPARPDYTPGEINFDADLCRAIAAALFDNPDAATFQSLGTDAALAALDDGEIDVYLGPGREAHSALFVDATGALARNDVGIRTLADLKFTTVCLIQDSPDERRFNEAIAAERITVQPFLFNSGEYDAMYAAYDQGRCDAVVDDRLRLARRLSTLSVPREQSILDVALIAGTRAWLTPPGDAQWTSIVEAIRSALLRAEALGVSSLNLDEMLASEDPAVRQLLGVEGDAGSSLGLSGDFAVRAIRHVGNYAEIYERHYAVLPRGPNALVKDGGMLEAP
jgi:general L-amino acid transport system substrate-binding protein